MAKYARWIFIAAIVYVGWRLWPSLKATVGSLLPTSGASAAGTSVNLITPTPTTPAAPVALAPAASSATERFVRKLFAK